MAGKRAVVGAAVGLMALGGTLTGTLVRTATAQASPSSGQGIAVTGKQSEGIKTAQQDQVMDFRFKITNRGAQSVVIDRIIYTWTNVNDAFSDHTDTIECPLTTNHYDINSDGNICEPSANLAHGQSELSGVVVQAGTNESQPVTVTACVYLQEPNPPAVCKTVSVPLD